MGKCRSDLGDNPWLIVNNILNWVHGPGPVYKGFLIDSPEWFALVIHGLLLYFQNRQFKKGVGVESKYDKAYVGDDPNEEEMYDINLDDVRARHWRMVSMENYGGVDYANVLLHDKRWDVYVNEKEKIIKGGYLVEVVGSNGNNILWGVVDNHVVEEGNVHDEIGLRGFGFKLFGKDKEGIGR